MHGSKTCVVYEVKSGKILHIHTILSLLETKAPTQRELEQEALKYFRKNKAHRKRDVKTLNIHESEVSALPFAVKVDHARRRLVFQKKDKTYTTKIPDILRKPTASAPQEERKS